MNKITADFSPDQEEWIAMRVAEGGYGDAGEYLRDMVERDRQGLVAEPEEESPEYIAWVREQVAIGLASPILDKDPRDVIREIVARRHARSG